MRRRLHSSLVHLLLLLGVCLFALPLVGMLVTALKSEAQVQDISSLRRILIPEPMVWENFRSAVTRFRFLLYFGNSLYLVMMNVIGVALVCPLVAYGFARFR